MALYSEVALAWNRLARRAPILRRWHLQVDPARLVPRALLLLGCLLLGGLCGAAVGRRCALPSLARLVRVAVAGVDIVSIDIPI